jgi:hypothetical protein
VALKTLTQGFARIAGVLLGKRKGKVLLVNWKRMATGLRFEDRLDRLRILAHGKSRLD